MAAIEVGPEALDLSSTAGDNETVIAKAVPATGTGILAWVEIFLAAGGSPIAATFQNVGGDTFTARDSEALGALGAGYTKKAVGINVVAGDYIGVYLPAGCTIDRHGITGGGQGYWYLAGDQTSCVNQVFTAGAANRDVSVHGESANGPSSVKPNWGQIVG